MCVWFFIKHILITMEVRDEMEVLERDEPLKAHRLKMKIIDTKCWDKLQVVESFQQSERGSQREEGFNEFVDKPTWISRISSCPGQDLDSAKACWKKPCRSHGAAIRARDGRRHSLPQSADSNQSRSHHRSQEDHESK